MLSRFTLVTVSLTCAIFVNTIFAKSVQDNDSADQNAENMVTLTAQADEQKTKLFEIPIIERINKQLTTTWNNFRCQVYQKAIIPAAKLLNVKTPVLTNLVDKANCSHSNSLDPNDTVPVASPTIMMKTNCPSGCEQTNGNPNESNVLSNS